MSQRLIYFFISALILGADLWTKHWAVAELKDAPARPVIPGFFSFDYTENTGIALGLFGDGGAFTKWILIAVSVGAAVFVIGYLLRAPLQDRFLLAALSLLLAGITGNLWDRFVRGYVVDFISFYYEAWHWHFPIFNIADMAISTGAALLALDLLRTSAKTGEAPAASVTEQRVTLDENAP